MRSQLYVSAPKLRPLAFGLLGVAALLAACGTSISTDGISTGSLGGTTSRSGAQSQTAAAPALNGNTQRQAYGPPPAHAGPQGYRQPGTNQPYQAQPYQRQAYQAPQQTWHASPRGTPVYGAPNALGYGSGTIKVQPGDTLYSISRRHGVSVASLVDTNHLSGIAIKPGQRLRLPAGAR